jgi:protein phosphatase
MLYFPLPPDTIPTTQTAMAASRSRRPRTVEFAGTTDRGTVRTENQDASGKFPEGPYDPEYPAGQLFVVADGMGGHNAGREASELAVKTVGEVFLEAPPSQNPGATLAGALQTANLRIHDEGSSDPAYRGMGTTCTALLLKGNRSFIAHVGDSRAYLVAGSGIVQLTEDHTRVGELVRAGVITSAQAREHPERSLLNRALGARATVTVDILDGPALTRPCTFVLCTDGLYTHVDDEEIRAAVTAHPPAESSRNLTGLAIQRGGLDNITVFVIRISSTLPQHTTANPGPARRRDRR